MMVMIRKVLSNEINESMKERDMQDNQSLQHLHPELSELTTYKCLHLFPLSDWHTLDACMSTMFFFIFFYSCFPPSPTVKKDNANARYTRIKKK